jgi:hypothetical protein
MCVVLDSPSQLYHRGLLLVLGTTWLVDFVIFLVPLAPFGGEARSPLQRWDSVGYFYKVFVERVTHTFCWLKARKGQTKEETICTSL